MMIKNNLFSLFHTVTHTQSRADLKFEIIEFGSYLFRYVYEEEEEMVSWERGCSTDKMFELSTNELGGVEC